MKYLTSILATAVALVVLGLCGGAGAIAGIWLANSWVGVPANPAVWITVSMAPAIVGICISPAPSQFL